MRRHFDSILRTSASFNPFSKARSYEDRHAAIQVVKSVGVMALAMSALTLLAFEVVVAIPENARRAADLQRQHGELTAAVEEMALRCGTAE